MGTPKRSGIQNSRSRQQEVVLILVSHPPCPPLFSTHLLIQLIVLPCGEEGGEGEEVEEQHNLSGGVDSKLRNGLESKMLGADSSSSSLFLLWHPLIPPSFFTLVLVQVIVIQHGDKGREGGEVEEKRNLFAGVDSGLRNGP